MKHFFFASLLVVLAACSSERESAGRKVTDVVPRTVRGEVSTTETVGETGRNHGYVRRFYQEQGQYYLTVDYIQFLTGGAALAAARRKGDALAEVQNGDTVHSVFNDYYIINDDAQLRTLHLADQATLTFWRSGKNGLEQYSASPAQVLAQTPDALRLSPFIVETKQGLVVSATEQYVP
ncbi:MAG TPA: hypothetical protein VK364_13150 [Hymenobacter sp.]|nr:hypothetical protein [Hymenobacter sp.]